MQRRAYTLIARQPAPNPGPGRHTAVLVAAGNRAVRTRLVSDLKDAGYTVHDADEPTEALRLVWELEQLDILLCDVTTSNVDGVNRLANQALAIQPTLKVIGMFRRGRTPSGGRKPAARRLWLESLIEAVLGSRRREPPA